MDSQKTALVTGASTGIGLASVEELARRGWRVFAGVRRTEDAERLNAIADVTALILDVTQPAQIKAAAAAIQEQVGSAGLQGLVNNAGVAVGGPLEFLPIDKLRWQMEVNFISQVELTQACLSMLRAGRGRIVNISSIGGRIVAPLLAPYSASKFALEAFSDGLRRELSPWKMPVIVIQAGSIATPIWQKSLSVAESLSNELPAQARSLYGPMMERGRHSASATAARGLPAADAGRLVAHALTTRWPRTRYIIGRGTWFNITMSRFLPDALLDWAISKLY
jgi:NAD(P)-dependent dehydrogenase (short-subunit alcohol dehydrogenase family)